MVAISSVLQQQGTGTASPQNGSSRLNSQAAQLVLDGALAASTMASGLEVGVTVNALGPIETFFNSRRRTRTKRR